MIKEIKTIDEVKEFFHCLLGESLNFHPDTDFNDYINGTTGLSSYTPPEAQLRNELLDQAFEVCEKYHQDIYEICIEIFS